MNQSVETYLELLQESINRRNGVLDRHTRHYYNAKCRLSAAEWEAFRSTALKRFGVDVNDLAERAEMLYHDETEDCVEFLDDVK
jgi:hypothetical protein